MKSISLTVNSTQNKNTESKKRSLFSVFLSIVEPDVSLPTTNTEIIAVQIQKSFIFSDVVPFSFELHVSLSTVNTCFFHVIPIFLADFKQT